MSYIPTRIELEQLLRKLSNNDSILRMATMKAIWTAAVAATHPSQGATDTTTASISVGSADSIQIQELFRDLESAGLQVTNSGSTFTVTF